MAFGWHGVRAIILCLLVAYFMISFAFFLSLLDGFPIIFACRLARIPGTEASTLWIVPCLRIATFIPTAGSVAWTKSIFSLLISWMILTCAMFAHFRSSSLLDMFYLHSYLFPFYSSFLLFCMKTA